MIGVHRPVYHLHIPKTGGTSLSYALARRFPEDHVFRDSGTISIAYLESLGARLNEPGLICGHPTPGLAAYLRDKADVVTILREPEEQAISHYLHARIDPEHPLHQAARTLSLLDYMKQTPQHLAFQAQILGGFVSDHFEYSLDYIERRLPDILRYLDEAAFVGVIERREDSFACLSAMLGDGAPIHLPHLNSAVWRGSDAHLRRRLHAEYRAIKADPDLGYITAIEDLVYTKANAVLDRHVRNNSAAVDSLIDLYRSGRLPASVFSSPNGGFEQRRHVCALEGASGHLIYGPYESLPPGLYEVEFHFTLAGINPGDGGALQVEVVAHGARMLSRRLLGGADTPSRRRRTLKFRNADPTDVLEFRVYSTGFRGGVLTFDGVTIRRAGLKLFGR